MMKRLISLGAATLAALVGGCGDGPSTVPGGYRSAAVWSSFVYATASGPLLLEMRGTPFAHGTDLGATVLSSVGGALPQRPFTTTLDPAQAPRPQFRLHLVFGPVPELTERAVCAGQAKGSGQPVGDGRLDVLAVFCDGDSPLSSSRGWVARLSGAEDRRFRLLLEQLTRDLLSES